MLFTDHESVEEMDLAMRLETQLANDRALPEQRRISGGDHWMMLAEDHLVIFGYVYTYTEAILADLNAGATRKEADHNDRALKADYANGYRYGRAYSLVCPTGELGSTHVSQVMKIAKRQFEAMREHKWNMYDALECKNHRSIALGLATRWDVLQERIEKEATHG